MIDAMVGRRYAHALFEGAREENLVDAVEQDLDLLEEVWDRTPNLVRFFESPEVDLGRKKEFLRRVLPEELNALVMRFLDLLLDKKRIVYFPDIVSSYHDLADVMRGCCEVVVTSRETLTEDQKRRLGETLSHLMEREIHLVEDIDPGVIGGLRVRMRDRVIDRTLRSQLVALRENLLGARLLKT